VPRLGGIRGEGAIVAQRDGEDVVKELKKDDLSPALLSVVKLRRARN
jgi:aspartate oxidase